METEFENNSSSGSKSDITIDNIETREATSFDVGIFEGQRIAIDKVEIIEVIDKYPINPETGKGEFKADSTLKKKVVEIITKPLKVAKKDSATGEVTFGPEEVEIKTDEGTRPLLITHRFNLQSKDGEWFISKHQKAKLWKFMRKMGVENLKDIKDKFVTITVAPSSNPEDDKSYLNIVTE